jgi:stearoyl-CoA desaturase (Delta-9 desaturase)
MSQSTSVEPQAPLNWAPTLVFSLTFVAAVTLVPWWGFTHGFSVGA